ncbi:MAG: ubiquinol-cytochrome c reductase iron-sulfur subunit [Nitrospirota bacterium]|nr:MAG: ubiquinol-cytochrome c reductase iron-sulfur subunit [Nitrospirota bacterium]
MVRRDFLKSTVKIFFLLISIISVSVFSIFTYPWKFKRKELTFFHATDEEALPIKGVRQVFIKHIRGNTQINSKAFIVNSGSELFALSPVCTHLGCLVNWYRPKNRFLCPCHGGQYDMNGKVVKGPPPADLNRMPIKIEDGKVYIGLRV